MAKKRITVFRVESEALKRIVIGTHEYEVIDGEILIDKNSPDGQAIERLVRGKWTSKVVEVGEPQATDGG